MLNGIRYAGSIEPSKEKKKSDEKKKKKLKPKDY